MPDGDYPVQFSVDYPDRPLNRLTTGFRIFTVIPIAIVLAALVGGGTTFGSTTIAGAGAGLLFLPPLLMILFRQKYPRWWFDWNLELLRFTNRIYVYLALMDDRYPSTDERQSVRLDFPYPDAERDLNRWLPLVKWFLAIPHYIVLVALGLLALLLRRDRLVRDPVHRPLSGGPVRDRRGRDPLGKPGHRLRLPPGDRPLSAVQLQLRLRPSSAAGGAEAPLAPEGALTGRHGRAGGQLDQIDRRDRLGGGEPRHEELRDSVPRFDLERATRGRCSGAAREPLPGIPSRSAQGR